MQRYPSRPIQGLVRAENGAHYLFVPGRGKMRGSGTGGGDLDATPRAQCKDLAGGKGILLLVLTADLLRGD